MHHIFLPYFTVFFLHFALLSCTDEPPTSADARDAAGDVAFEDVAFEDVASEDTTPDLPPDTSDPTPTRSLGLALIPNSSDLSLSTAWQRALSLGASEPGDLNLDWADFETSPNTYTDPEGTIAQLKSLQGLTRISVTLAPFQTTYTSLPDDLRNTPWDDPILMERYLQASLSLMQQLAPIDVYTFAIGNEVDILLGDDPTAWAQWARLIAYTRRGLHAVYPDLHVSTKLTLQGWLHPQANTLLDVSDAVIATLYPLGANFQLRPKEAWTQDLNALLNASSLPIYLAEFGAPSSPDLGSSPALQAQAYRDLFAWWDMHQDRVPVVVAVWSADLPEAVLNALLDAYGLDDLNFAAFLATLGLRTRDDQPKPAWNAIHSEVCSRVFPIDDSVCQN